MCEIAGIGPVPVSVVRAMMGSGDPFLAAVVTKGADVANVAHLGRRATAHQLSALLWRDPECSVLGCNAKTQLEIDHVEDWATTKITLLSLLGRPCSHHHHLKTHKGWAFVDGVGKRPMVAPDDPRHPQNQGRAGPGPAPPPGPAAPSEEPVGERRSAGSGSGRAA